MRARHLGSERDAWPLLVVALVTLFAPLAVEAHLWVTMAAGPEIDMVAAFQSREQRAAVLSSVPVVAGGRAGRALIPSDDALTVAEGRALAWGALRYQIDRKRSARPDGVSCGPAGAFGARCIVHWPDGNDTRLRCPTQAGADDCRE